MRVLISCRLGLSVGQWAGQGKGRETSHPIPLSVLFLISRHLLMSLSPISCFYLWCWGLRPSSHRQVVKQGDGPLLAPSSTSPLPRPLP